MFAQVPAVNETTQLLLYTRATCSHDGGRGQERNGQKNLRGNEGRWKRGGTGRGPRSPFRERGRGHALQVRRRRGREGTLVPQSATKCAEGGYASIRRCCGETSCHAAATMHADAQRVTRTITWRTTMTGFSVVVKSNRNSILLHKYPCVRSWLAITRNIKNSNLFQRLLADIAHLLSLLGEICCIRATSDEAATLLIPGRRVVETELLVLIFVLRRVERVSRWSLHHFRVLGCRVGVSVRSWCH